jgi:peptidoglycan hydrolase-like protein with peptidoglycan-binding domain
MSRIRINANRRARQAFPARIIQQGSQSMTRFASVARVMTIAAACGAAACGATGFGIGRAFAQNAATAPLTYSQPLAPNSVQMVQEKLGSTGAYHGQVDGVWGPDSASALTNFQQTHGLQPTGEMNQATAVVLGLDPAALLGTTSAAAPAPAAPPLPPPVASTTLSIAAVRNLQARLRQLGYYDGAIDGQWGPAAEGALTRFQQASGIQASGRINPQTVTAMGLNPRDLTASAVQ